MSPADEKALLQEGIAAARAGDKAFARSRFRELTAQNFDNELAWLWLASVADTPSHAIACLRRVLQINPSHEKARAALFRVLMENAIQGARAGDKTTAFAAFTEASTIDPGSELAWTWMASTAPSPRQALDALRRVLQLNPSHEQAGRAYRKLVVQHGVDLAQANDPAARVLLIQASQADPQNETVWLWLARVVPHDESIQYYERVLELNPDHDIARGALQQLRPTPEPKAEPEAEPLPDSIDVASQEALALAPVLEPVATLPAPAFRTHQIAIPDFLEADSTPASVVAAPADAPASDESMVVEQFRPDGPRDADSSSALTQASTKEEFLVYHGEDITAVWGSQPAAGGDAARSADERSVLVDAAAAAGNPAAETSIHGGSVRGAASDGGSFDNSDNSTGADGTGAYGAVPDEAAELTLRSASNQQGGVAPSDVDSYLAASESTYASSESSARAAGGEHGYASAHGIDDPLPGAHTGITGGGADVDGTEAAAANVGGETAATFASDDARPAGSKDGAGVATMAASPMPEPAEQAPAAAVANGFSPLPTPGQSSATDWTCPICMSGAPKSAARCPACGSVVTLVDPDLILDTAQVDRRHVLQVVARLKNRKVSGRLQYDHHFTLGLAYVNAGRMTEGIAHLRTASQLQPNDRELKAQIDAVERRAAQRAKEPAEQPAGRVNGRAVKKTDARPVELPVAPSPAEETVDLAPEPQPAYSPNGSTLNLKGAAAGETANGHGPRRVILVVDDSPTIQKVVSVTLEAHGHEVVTASDGMEALSKLRTMKPDLVLLDITMPHMDGYQLCRILRSHELTKQVPIVMLSGKDGLFDKMRGRMAGAATYITKPFSPSALPPLVEKYCKRAS